MGLYNTLKCDQLLRCPHCGVASPCDVQFKYSSMWCYEYRLGDTLRWYDPPNAIGVPAALKVRVHAIGQCPRCSGFFYTDIFVVKDVIHSVSTQTRLGDERGYEQYEILEPPGGLADTSPDANLARAMDSLEGLAVGDAFGEAMIGEDPASKEYPQGEWSFTDDTMMACSIVWCLRKHGRIVQDELAQHFAEQYSPGRGYGNAMHQYMQRIREGESWRTVAPSLFNGAGSLGNGAAMRVAPLGAYFAGSLETCLEQAALSAEVTHSHKDAVAGAAAVALMSAIACASPGPVLFNDAYDKIQNRIFRAFPGNTISVKLDEIWSLAHSGTLNQLAEKLGNGSRSLASDTVPICLLIAIRHADDYHAALRATVSLGGDLDTNCAIVGGILGGRLGKKAIPYTLRRQREPLPPWVTETAS